MINDNFKKTFDKLTILRYAKLNSLLSTNENFVIAMNMIALSLAWKYCKGTAYSNLYKCLGLKQSDWKTFAHFRKGRLNHECSTENKPLNLNLSIVQSIHSTMGISQNTLYGKDILFPQDEQNILYTYTILVRVQAILKKYTPLKNRADLKNQPLEYRNIIENLFKNTVSSGHYEIITTCIKELEKSIKAQLLQDYRSITPTSWTTHSDYIRMMYYMNFNRIISEYAFDSPIFYTKLNTDDFWTYLKNVSSEQLIIIKQNLESALTLTNAQLLLSNPSKES